MRTASALKRRQTYFAWALLTPAFLVMLAVGFYPLFSTLHLSFTNAYAGSTDWDWVGLTNYRSLLGEGQFWAAVRNTVVFTVGSVSLEMLLGLGVALVVHSEFRARGIMRATVLLPWALPTVVAAQMWAWMLNDAFGVVNDLLVYKLGLFEQPVSWLGQRGLAMLSLILVDVWKTTPFVALILLAGLQIIPQQLYEASKVDGASAFRRFWHVTIPLLQPALFVALIFRTLDALRVFDVVWVMTKGEFATESMATYAYRHLFDYSRLGYSSAVSVAIFTVIAIFVLIYVLLMRPDKELSV